MVFSETVYPISTDWITVNHDGIQFFPGQTITNPTVPIKKENATVLNSKIGIAGTSVSSALLISGKLVVIRRTLIMTNY